MKLVLERPCAFRTSDPGRRAVGERFVELDRHDVDAVRQFVHLRAPAADDVITGSDVISQCAVAPARARAAAACRVLSALDHQLVGESQLGVELDVEEAAVGEPTAVERPPPPPVLVGRRRPDGRVDARRLEVPGRHRHAHVEPELVECVGDSSTDVAAERVTYVVIDWLQRVAVCVACIAAASSSSYVLLIRPSNTCKWSYGPSCPMVFSIKYIHSCI